jgi:holo-[acyl-carrier protein] synthase
MIVGIGIDLVEIARFQAALDRGGERLVRRVFTVGERAACEPKAKPALHFAARFAAKEAAFKALGTGWSGGIAWTDAEVVSDEGGRPSLVLSGRAALVAARLGVARAHLSLTHTDSAAGACVVLEGAGGP